MRFAISIPQFIDDGQFDSAAFCNYLTRAEELGFHSAWAQEQVLGATPVLSPIETMTYAAACAQRLRLGCAVFVTPVNGPGQSGQELEHGRQLSRGRLEVGVGTGAEGRVFSAFGVDPRFLVARFNEGLHLMKALWTESQVTYEGCFWQLDVGRIEPKPVQKPHPPIWFGANQPAALRRAVKHGGGFFGAGSATTARFAELILFTPFADQPEQMERLIAEVVPYLT